MRHGTKPGVSASRSGPNGTLLGPEEAASRGRPFLLGRLPGAAVAPGWPSLHLVVRLEAVAHKRLPVVARQGLGARVGVALLHLLLLRHGRGLTLEAGGHERFALVTLLVSSLGVARLHALLLRVGFLLVGSRGD